MFKRIFLTFLLLFSSTAFALDPLFTFNVEPYAGWQFLGKLNKTGNKNPPTFNGFDIGTRAVLVFGKTIFLGIDISALPSLNYSYYTTSYQTDATASGVKFGLVAGIGLPLIPLRAWVGYNFIDNLSINSSSSSGTLGLLSYKNATENILYYGSSLKFGAAYTIIKNLSINAEYTHVSYANFSIYGMKASSLTLGNSTNNASDYSSDLLTVTISTPFNFSFI